MVMPTKERILRLFIDKEESTSQTVAKEKTLISELWVQRDTGSCLRFWCVAEIHLRNVRAVIAIHQFSKFNQLLLRSRGKIERTVQEKNIQTPNQSKKH